MDELKKTLKSAIQGIAEEVKSSVLMDPQGALQLSQAAANLTNVLSALVVIEDQELHNANIGKAEPPAGITH